MEDFLIKLATGFGVPGLMIGVWYLLEKQRNQTRAHEIAAYSEGFKSLSGRLDEHTKTDIQSHAETQQELAALGGAIYTALDLTPVRQVKPKTPARGVPAGYYAPRKPTVKDDD